MLPGKKDLALYRGDTYSWTYQCWANKAKTIPVVLDGCTAAAEFRDAPGGTSIVSFACTIVSPNTITVAMFKDMWDVAPSGGGAWDLEITFPDGSVRTFIAGDVDVTEDVTHSDQPVTFAALMSAEAPAPPVNQQRANLRSA
jgi:hypothetical protein